MLSMEVRDLFKYVHALFVLYSVTDCQRDVFLERNFIADKLISSIYDEWQGNYVSCVCV